MIYDHARAYVCVGGYGLIDTQCGFIYQRPSPLKLHQIIYKGAILIIQRSRSKLNIDKN